MDSTENQMAEMSREFKSRSKTKVILESGLYVLIVLFLFVGNCLTLLVMMLNRRMRTIPNMFVASLAVSDLLIGVFSVAPLSIPTLVTSHWPFNDTTCQFQGYVVGMLAATSIHTLVLTAVNRYYRIVKPTKYRRYFTKKKTLIIIFVSWLNSICAPLIFVLSGNKIVFLPSKFFCFFFQSKKGHSWPMVFHFILVFQPVLLFTATLESLQLYATTIIAIFIFLEIQ